jgi:hypothetical protein
MSPGVKPSQTVQQESTVGGPIVINGLLLACKSIFVMAIASAMTVADKHE